MRERSGNQDFKCAIVTGASGTLGSMIAIALIHRGISVVAIGRSRDRLEALKQRVQPELANRLHLVPLDVTDFLAVQSTVQQAAEEHGPPQILVNGAGNYGVIGNVAETDPAAWRLALDVNLMGAYNCCRSVLPYMIAARGGSIISLAGGGASGPLEHLSSYGVSKAAIVRLMDSIAGEVSEFGVRANAVLPGPVDSPMQDQLLAAGAKSGHWHEKIRALRERGEGGVAPARTVALIEFLLFGLGISLSGKLLSARYDHFQDWSAEQVMQISRSPLYSLRRVDPATIFEVLKIPFIKNQQA